MPNDYYLTDYICSLNDACYSSIVSYISVLVLDKCDGNYENIPGNIK